MAKKKTHEQFLTEVYSLVGGEYEVLEDYYSARSKIKFKHNSQLCNYYEFKMTPDGFLTGNRCPSCAGNKKKTHDEFVIEVYDLVKDEYTILSEYKSANTHINILHNVCNTNYPVKPSNFLSGKRCPTCADKKRADDQRMTHQQFVDKVFELGQGKYIVLSKYVNSHTKIKIKHSLCNYEYNIRPANFIRGDKCPKCARCVKKTTMEYKQEIFDLVASEYIVLGEYITAHVKVRMKHVKCNYEYEVVPNSFLSGSRCPNCNESKGERKIKEWLQENNLKFNSQYEFENLKGLGGKNLKFDFALHSTNGEHLTLIEYDGEFHFKNVYDGDEHKKIVEHDKRKNNYCRKNSIPLFRIPFWKFADIEMILNKIIHNEQIETDENFMIIN